MIANRKTLLLSTVAVVAAFGLVGCGDESSAGDAGSGDCVVEVTGETDAKPEIVVPDCEPPTELEIRDVVEGSGAEAGQGSAVSVQYVGVAWSTKDQFDASWDNGGQPFQVVPLGAAQVIDGWNEGLMGAQVGDRRLLVIPPDLGYGSGGAGSAIGPDETLVFVVDVVEVA